MATNTYVALATQTLASTQTSVTFSSIPSTYTDLVLVINAATASGTLASRLQFNADTSSSGTNYSTTWIAGNGTAASSSRDSNGAGILIDNGTNETTLTTNRICQIMNYSNTTTYKTVVTRFNDAAKGTGATVGLWRSTAAISSVVVWASFATETYSVGSTFTLYGILAEGGAKATGGVVTSDANYYYHTFLASGTFTPKVALTCDYLVVAGGGSGGSVSYGGGGGAGGLRSTVTATGGGGSLETALSLSATGYTVTIGAGGPSNTNGSNTTFSTITSTGGGKGGILTGTSAGSSGGSGGGGGARTGTAGAGTANQGYAGGSAVYSPTYLSTSSAGGGGAGAVGGNAVNVAQSTAGAGGIGVAISDLATATNTGVSNYYAGGGGGEGRNDDFQRGGTGGAGGGGNGYGYTTAVTNGTVNTGGGGGGGAGNTGGSGIVIVRYAK